MQTQGLAKPDRLWQVIDQVQPDLLIVDLLLPDISGLEVCQQIRQHRRWAKLPILVLSARSDRNTINQVFAAGADDYISKPIDAEELLTRLTNRLSRYRLLQGASSTHRLPLS
jgi:DNA-binding response OmpR family regulator